MRADLVAALAQTLFDRGEAEAMQDACVLWQEAAALGHAAAAEGAGRLLVEGVVPGADPEAGEALLTQAARAGRPVAALVLGLGSRSVVQSAEVHSSVHRTVRVGVARFGRDFFRAGRPSSHFAPNPAPGIGVCLPIRRQT